MAKSFVEGFCCGVIVGVGSFYIMSNWPAIATFGSIILDLAGLQHH